MNIKEDIAQANRILDKLKADNSIQKETREQLIKSVERYKEDTLERNKKIQEAKKER